MIDPPTFLEPDDHDTSRLRETLETTVDEIARAREKRKQRVREVTEQQAQKMEGMIARLKKAMGGS